MMKGMLERRLTLHFVASFFWLSHILTTALSQYLSTRRGDCNHYFPYIFHCATAKQWRFQREGITYCIVRKHRKCVCIVIIWNLFTRSLNVHRKREKRCKVLKLPCHSLVLLLLSSTQIPLGSIFSSTLSIHSC